jgi:ketosteroid isomerase-like protein
MHSIKKVSTMKKGVFFLAALFCAAFTPMLNAQDVDKEMAAFAQQFQDAYNKEDHAALKTFYAADAKRIAKDGSAINGADAIAAFWEAQFKGSDATLALVQESVVWKDNVHAYVTHGTYHVTGVSAKGDKIDISGKYANTMLKVDGAWKITESALVD